MEGRLWGSSRYLRIPEELPYPGSLAAGMACCFPAPTFQKDPACRQSFSALALRDSETRPAISELRQLDNSATERREEPTLLKKPRLSQSLQNKSNATNDRSFCRNSFSSESGTEGNSDTRNCSLSPNSMFMF